MRWDRTKLDRKLSKAGVGGRFWGQVGRSAVTTIEERLGFGLDNDMDSFAEFIGNVQIGPIEILVTGAETADFNVVTETATLPLTEAQVGRVLKIGDHAGESYLYDIKDHTVSVYDSFDLENPTMHFADLETFLDWTISFAAENNRK